MSPERVPNAFGSFTLIELVSVVALIALLAALLVPAFSSLRRADDINTAAREIANAFDQARTYAIQNDTYTWLGIYEESATASAPTNSTPPYPGRGRVILAIVASKDGTTGCQDPSSTTSNRIPLTPNQVAQVGKLTKIEGIHLTDIGPPPSPPPSSADPNSIEGRPNFPYASGSPALDYQNRISNDDAHAPLNQTLYPFSAQGYVFCKTIRFNPRGEVNINSTYALRRVAEIGLKGTHADAVETSGATVVAIQFSGVSGTCKIYHK